MDDDFAFVRAVLNQPDNDVVRLVYADWLDDRGDPRAEYLRLEVERRHSTGRLVASAALEKRMRELSPTLDSRWVQRMWYSRNLPSGARQDLITVTDGKGLIEVRGEGETVLLVEGKPVALNWDDCQGSVGQSLVFTGHTRGADYARQLTEFVNGEPDGGRPLAEQIEPLLALFASGTYGLWYTPSGAGEGVATFECPAPVSAFRDLIEYYPVGQRNLVCTQATTTMDVGRVGFFRERIRAGFRPTVLTTSAGSAWCEFVIDGHHKLAAYSQEGVQPAVLCINRESAPGVSLDEGLAWFPPGHPGIPEYRRLKGDG